MFRITISPVGLDTFSIHTEAMPQIGEGVIQVISPERKAKYFPLANILEITIEKLEEK